MKKTLLFVPGFVCDTYTSIEHMSTLLSKHLEKEFNIVWIVPTIKCNINRFKNSENKYKLTEPLYVSHLRKKGIKTINADFSKFNLVNNFILFRKIFHDVRPYCVFTQYGIERFHTAFFAKLFGKQVIWYEHWNSLGTKFILPKKVFYQLFIDEFITVSDFIAGTLPRNKRINIIPNAREIKKYQETDKNKIKKKLQLEKFDLVILMIAAFRPDKRHDIAIDIADKVLAHISNLNIGFVFVGSGETYDNCKKKIEKKGLGKSIKMPGHVNNVDEYLLASDIHYLTSVNEAFGMCHLEAMNYRLPVLAFESITTKPIIKNGVNGYLITFPDSKEFADRIIELVQSKEHTKKLGDGGYEILSNNFNMKTWTTNMSTVFHRIINN